jgi:DNA repair protein RadD
MKLRDYQQESCDALWEWGRTHGGNPLLVLPTGSGKSLVIAALIRQAIAKWNWQSLMVTHRKELISQNAEKLQAMIPGIDVGIFSAGMKRKQTHQAVVCCGIQSAYKRGFDFGERKMVIVDEAHLVSTRENSMYQTFFADLRIANPTFKIIGLTATPFRTESGDLVDHTNWHGVAYEAPVKRLMDENYLASLTNQTTRVAVDTTLLKVRRGEFIESDLAQAFGEASMLNSSTDDLIAKTKDRKSIICFCVNRKLAQQTAEIIKEKTGEEVLYVDGDTPPLFRSQALEDFKNRKARFLVGINVLTTGFDAPCVDCVAVLRATQSAGLFAQICGRGMRLYPGKTDCLILDYGENLKRHGTLDAADYGRKKKNFGPKKEVATHKTCGKCDSPNLLSAQFCEHCGAKLVQEREVKVEEQSDSEHAIFEHQKKPTVLFVEQVTMHVHTPRGEGKTRSLRIDYHCIEDIREGKKNLVNERRISEWICLEHTGFARHKAEKTWGQFCVIDAPFEIEEAIDLWERGACRVPVRITVVPEGKYSRISEKEFEDPKPKQWTAKEDKSAVPFDDDYPF